MTVEALFNRASSELAIASVSAPVVGLAIASATSSILPLARAERSLRHSVASPDLPPATASATKHAPRSARMAPQLTIAFG
jgi:hypothetical protein